jgi:hypothetical protein
MSGATHRRALKRKPPAAPSADEVLSRAAVRAADLLGLRRNELAEIIGVSPSTVSRFEARPVDPARKEGQLALLFVRLFRSLDALVGGSTEKGRAWLHAENHHLAGIPAALIKSPEGLVNVVQYLDAMRGKI